MKVIFIKDLPGTAKKGEVKDVSGGYAQNFLIAKGFAQIVTPQLEAKLSKEAKEAAAKKEKDLARMQALKQDLEKRTISFKVKVGDKGQIFGSVHEKDIAKAINDKTGSNVEKHQIDLASPIKELGMHQAKVKLSSSIIASVKINIEAF